MSESFKPEAASRRSIPWSVVIIASRETPLVLRRTVDAAVAAAAGNGAVIDVIVNGHRNLAEAVAPMLKQSVVPDGVTVRLWFLAFGDKAHAWNVFIHEIYQPCRLAFFLDGYVLANADAFTRMQRAIDQDSKIVAVSGVPDTGRSARSMAEELVATQGLHGNLHAIAADAVSLLQSHQFKLPVGLYRVDGMVGAVLRYRCEPSCHDWNSGRIVVEPHVRWHVAEPGSLNWSGVVAALKRRLRQAQGELENRAMRSHLTLHRFPANTVDGRAGDFVQRWMRENPRAARKLWLRNPLTWYAARKLALPRDWALLAKSKELLLSLPS